MAKINKKKYASSALFVAIMASAMTVSFSEPAKAQYLLDRFFGNKNSRPTQSIPDHLPQAPRQDTAPAKPVFVPKVSAPKIYTYRPDALASLTLEPFAAFYASQIAERETDENVTDSNQFIAAVNQFKLMSFQAEKTTASALQEYYTQNPDFIWIENGSVSERAVQVMKMLDSADQYGLSVADYLVHLPEMNPASESLSDQDQTGSDTVLEELLRFELNLSAKALRYARDVSAGRIDPNKLSGFHDFPKSNLNETNVLEMLAISEQPDSYLLSLHPQNDMYKSLVKELANLRAEKGDDIVISADLLLRPGETSHELPLILKLVERDSTDAFRQEHAALFQAHRASEHYVSELVPLIKAAQNHHGLQADGVIGRRTVAAIAGDTKEAKINKVWVTLERLRWHPSYFGETRVVLNVPAYNASYVENGVEKLSMRTVVGTITNQTNFFFDEIQYVEFNPYWGVPRSILINEKLPRLRQDASYLDRTGYEVFDGRGRQISSASVNWAAYDGRTNYSVRQKPGPSNSLGELKIMFPNKHDIYMHDTPSKDLFRRDSRSFSHGCVRLEDPRGMAAAVLGTDKDAIGTMISGGRNNRKNVPTKIPVYVAYFTAWPDASGTISYFEDIYGRDSNLLKAVATLDSLRSAGS